MKKRKVPQLIETLRKAMKKLISFVFALLLVFCPIAVQAKEITEAPAREPISVDALNYLLSEDMYQGSLYWQGNKASTKFNYDKPKKK